MDRRTHGDYPVRALITCLFLMLAQPANATDLRSAYNAARAYDAEIQAAEFDLEAARQRVPLARSAFRPQLQLGADVGITCLLYTSPSPRDATLSRMPSSA